MNNFQKFMLLVQAWVEDPDFTREDLAQKMIMEYGVKEASSLMWQHKAMIRELQKEASKYRYELFEKLPDSGDEVIYLEQFLNRDYFGVLELDGLEELDFRYNCIVNRAVPTSKPYYEVLQAREQEANKRK
jgi:hypothetical protein